MRVSHGSPDKHAIAAHATVERVAAPTLHTRQRGHELCALQFAPQAGIERLHRVEIAGVRSGAQNE